MAHFLADQTDETGGRAVGAFHRTLTFYLNLNWSNLAAGDNPPADPRAAQAWVISTLSAKGRFAVALDAFRLDDACAANHFVP